MRISSDEARGAVVLIVLLLGAGCLESRSTICGELFCPGGMVCSPDGQRCVTPAQISACNGKTDGEACTLPDVASAQCLNQLCTAVICGDGLQMTGEACDDGNTLSCDGCSDDCRTVEGCGNGIVECREQCDDGAQNSMGPNAACRTDCRRQRCGDGIIDNLSGEDCDGMPPTGDDCQSLGFYSGRLGCSAACRADLTTCSGSCGDGTVEGVELCDGLPPQGRRCLDFGYDVGNLYCSSLCTPSFAGCERLGFEPIRTGSLTPQVNTMWSLSPDEVFSAGVAGEILRYDGTRWSTMMSSATASLYGLFGTARDNIYAVGRAGTIVHFDGVDWTAQDAGTTVQLNSVWASGPNDVFIVGRSGLILHSDGGGAWEQQTVPVTSRFSSVWGASPSSVFAVSQVGEILHYDGEDWALMTVPPEIAATFLYGIWGTGPTDVFAVGSGGMIGHYNGVEWSVMNSGTTTFLNAVDGNGPNDVYVSAEQGLVLHYNGFSWTPIPTGSTQDLTALSVHQDRVVVGGGSIIEEFKAGIPTASVVKTGLGDSVPVTQVTSIWSSSLSNIFATNSDGKIVKFNGTNWVDTNSGVNSGEELWALWGSGPNDVFAVGTGGLVLHYNGTAWSRQQSNATEVLSAVWGTSATNVYAVGDVGTLIHYNGTEWTPIPTGVSELFYVVWGTGPNDVYAVGRGGAVLRFNGSGWASLDTGTSYDFWGVWGTGPNDVTLFADVDGVMRFDGTRFAQATLPTPKPYNFGVGWSQTDIFAVEYLGQGVFHYNGVDWTEMKMPLPGPTTIYSTPSKMFIGTLSGDIIEIDRHCASKENSCGDRWDNDCDGLLNCVDSDCIGDPLCGSGGLCQTLSALTCNSVTVGSTLSGTPMIERYGCAVHNESGRERIYRFEAPRSGNVTVNLDAQVALDVIVLGSQASGGCDPLNQCLTASTEQNGKQQVTFAATQGITYYIVVDGADAAAGNYELEVGCP